MTQDTEKLAEQVKEAAAKDQGCKLPPEGWWCSRAPGHEGPCAARPTAGDDPLIELIREWMMSSDYPVSEWERNFAAAIRAMPTPTTPVADDGLRDVEQCDRDAAADFLAGDGHAFDKLWSHQVRGGSRDDHVLVQGFARYRAALQQGGSGEGTAYVHAYMEGKSVGMRLMHERGGSGDAVREALIEMRSRRHHVADFYDRNGPQWTISGGGYYSAEDVANNAREDVEFIDAALSASPPTDTGEANSKSDASPTMGVDRGKYPSPDSWLARSFIGLEERWARLPLCIRSRAFSADAPNLGTPTTSPQSEHKT